jgi:CubicO group peptidase (beta-lactamase class C family)
MSYRFLLLYTAVTTAVPTVTAPCNAQVSGTRIAAATDSIVSAALEAHHSVSYAVGVERTGTVIVAKGYGMADLESNVPATARTIYRLGSITKQFTASAIMQLVEQGKVHLDDEITDFLPDYPTQGYHVTIEHLLTHTSGIKSYTGLGERFWNVSARDLSHDEMLNLFENEPFDFAPGEKYMYNNSAFYLLGMIIEKVSGEPYDEYLEAHIFEPLALSSTSYCHEDNIIVGRAQGYRREDGEFLNDKPISMNTPGAAGALCSTVGDLMQWQDAFNQGRVVSPASRQRMITPETLNDGSKTQYGFGLGIGDLDGHAMISHGGGINGFSTQLNYFPDDNLTVVVLANAEGSDPGRVARTISRVALGLELPVVKDLALPAGTLVRYEGTYQLGEIEIPVAVQDGRLFIQPPGQGSVRLMAQGNDVFLVEADPEVQLTFNVTSGRAESFTLRQGGGEQTAKRLR